MHTASAVFSLRECSLRLTTPQYSMCSTGLRYTLLVMLGRDWEWLATWLAITAATLHFLHSAGLEQALGKFGLIGRTRLQRLSEVAHLGCALKVIAELGADVPFIISVAAGGKQCTRYCSMSSRICCPITMLSCFVDCNKYSAPCHIVMQHHCHDTRL